MSITENQTEEVKKTSKNYHDTMPESIAKMKLAFGNATLPEIFAALVVVGYTAEKLAGINEELTGLDKLCQAQVKEYADQDQEQERLNNKRDEVGSVFIRHRGMARILFKGDVHAWVALQLHTDIPKAFSAWMQMVTNFYAQFAANPAMQQKANTIGLTAEVIASQQQGIEAVQKLKESLRSETAEAQAATEARDKAFDTLYPKYRDYIKYAKILLPNNQALEAIGVTVKAK